MVSTAVKALRGRVAGRRFDTGHLHQYEAVRVNGDDWFGLGPDEWAGWLRCTVCGHCTEPQMIFGPDEPVYKLPWE